MPRADRDPGSGHLRRIGGYQVALLVLGGPAWLLRSPRAAGAFLLGGLTSLLFWHLHRWLVVRMLSPSVRMRWAFGGLAVLKLALIAVILHAIMNCFPLEAVPIVTGLLLFSAAILLEAVYVLFRPNPEENG